MSTESKVNELDEHIRGVVAETEAGFVAGWLVLVDLVDPSDTDKRYLVPVTSPGMSRWTYRGMLIEGEDLWGYEDEEEYEED